MTPCLIVCPATRFDRSPVLDEYPVLRFSRMPVYSETVDEIEAWLYALNCWLQLVAMNGAEK